MKRKYTRREKHQYVSPTMASNIFTMGACEQVNPLQTIGNLYTAPCENIRVLRAKLLMEECLETIEAMGVTVNLKTVGRHGMEVELPIEDKNELTFSAKADADMVKVIDGACDVKYVSVGILASFGVPDAAHQEIVNIANIQKFPNGIAIMDENGKYQKPQGWEDPKKSHEDTMFTLKACLKENFLFRKGGQWASTVQGKTAVMEFFGPRENRGS